MTGDVTGEMLVDELVVRMPEGCVPQNYAADVLEVMKEAGVEYLPVLDSFSSGRALGIVSRSDLERLVGGRGHDRVQVADAMSIDVPHVRLGTAIREILDAPPQVPVVLVNADDGRCIGYVELRRIAHAQ